MPAIKRVWIEDGCILCHACEQVSPSIFRVADATTVIRAEAREDGVESMNIEERSDLLAALRDAHADDIVVAAEGCPIEIIRYDVV